MQITNLNHKHFRTHLETALMMGRPLLIEDVGKELDPTLDNLLEKNFIKSGSMYKVRVNLITSLCSSQRPRRYCLLANKVENSDHSQVWACPVITP